MWALDGCLAISAAGMIWFKFIMPILPPTRWVRYSLTPLGLVFLYCLVEVFIANLVTDPIVRWIKNEHNRVVTGAANGKEN